MVKLTQKQQKYLNHFDAEPPGVPHLNLLVFYWVLWLYYFWVKRSLRNPREKKKCFSGCNSMGVIPDEPEFFSSLL